jgi:hypothetical protein
MAATQLEIDSYIVNIRSAFADYGEALALKQRLGKTDIFCDKMKLMLLSSYIDCINDYMLQYSQNITDGVSDVSDYNFFTVAEIRDVMQHINNICKTNYIITL